MFIDDATSFLRVPKGFLLLGTLTTFQKDLNGRRIATGVDSTVRFNFVLCAQGFCNSDLGHRLRYHLPTASRNISLCIEFTQSCERSVGETIEYLFEPVRATLAAIPAPYLAPQRA